MSVLSLSHTASEAEPEAEAGPPPSQLRAELEGVESFITGPGVEGVKPGISTVFMKQSLIDAACARAPSFAALASFSDQDLEEVIRDSGAKGIASLRFRRIIRFASSELERGVSSAELLRSVEGHFRARLLATGSF